MRYLYSALLYVLSPLVVLRMLLRSRRVPDYRRRLAERFGIFTVPSTSPSDTARPAIWVHAVSVGETLAAAPVIESLLQAYPNHRLVVTTTTPTGSQRVQALFGGRVFHVYAPWDLPGSVRRFLHRTRPCLLLIVETELWPNMLHYSRARGCRIVLANARLSERSARGYARFGGLTRSLLEQLDTVACQSAIDGQRFTELGLPARALQVTGNIKFDLELNETLCMQAAALRRDYGADKRPILVVASTHAGEDGQILAAFATLRRSVDDCLLVIVPRHPERFDAVHSLCVSAGWQVLRRSGGETPAIGDDIVLGDTMGELLLLLGVATVAVIGGSLVEHGGHNVLEAAAWGVPVVTGPHMFNFAGASDLLVSAGAMIMLEDTRQLGAALVELLGDPDRRLQMGAAALQVMADNRGAKKLLLELVAENLTGASISW
ncbi:MAG: 3-deoxy-D-manno-octulosonic acid transferase [Gammaproteobacteria bacterium]|nr:MAG: 3-deoxy-D-manno-octulosonic acid transferase [Gammaproteobacteria bacterium]